MNLDGEMPRRKSEATSPAGLHYPQCEECGRFCLRPDLEPWKAFLTAAEPPEIIFYCSACAAREFG